MNRTTRAIVGAIVLSVAMVAPTFALSPGAQTYQQVATVSATVSYQTTFTGLPSSLTFPAGMAGTPVSAPQFTLSASTNDPNGFIEYAHSAPLSDGAGHTIAATAFSGVAGTVAGCTLASGWNPGPKSLTGNDDTLCSAASTVASSSVPVTLTLTPTAGQAPGVYTGNAGNGGSFIFKLTEQ